MKNILVTGAFSSIGRAMCRQANAVGMRCIMVDSMRDAVEFDRTELNTTNEVCNLLYGIDLSQTKQIDGMMASIKANGIQLEAFVHCAESSPNMSIVESDTNTLFESYAVNVFSFIQIAKYILLESASLGGAAILAISSVLSKHPFLGRCAYGSSKAALNSAVKNVAKEGKLNGIRANALVLGAVEDSTEPNGLVRNLAAIMHPLGKVTPDEVAEYSMYLISEKGKRITGQEIYMDSGYCIS